MWCCSVKSFFCTFVFKECQWIMLMPCKVQPVIVEAIPQMKMGFCWRKERSPWNKSPSQSRPWSIGPSSCLPHPNTLPRLAKWTCLNIHLETPPHLSSMPRSTAWTARWEPGAPCPQCQRFPPVPVLSPTMPPQCRGGTCQHTLILAVWGVVPQSTLKMCTTHQISIMWFKGLSLHEDRSGITVLEDTTPGVRGQLHAWTLLGARPQSLSVERVTVIRNRAVPCRNSRTIRLFLPIVKMTISSYMNRSKVPLGLTTCPPITLDTVMCVAEMGDRVGIIPVSPAWMSPALLSIIITSKWTRKIIIKVSLIHNICINIANIENLQLWVSM